MSAQEFKDARAKLGLTVIEMAKLLGVHKVQIRRYQTPEDLESHREVPPDKATMVRTFLAGYRPADWPKPKKRKK